MTNAAHPLLELRGIRSGYGPIEVLHGVDLQVNEGEVYALLGPNGGGKSTTLKVCAGLLPAAHGELRVAGRTVNGVTPDALARLGRATHDLERDRELAPNPVVVALGVVAHGWRASPQVVDAAV